MMLPASPLEPLHHGFMRAEQPCRARRQRPAWHGANTPDELSALKKFADGGERLLGRHFDGAAEDAFRPATILL